jgi:WD40 repeat protein
MDGHDFDEFAPDREGVGHLSASGRALAWLVGDRIELWDLDHRRRVAQAKLRIGRLDPAQEFAFSGDDRTIALGFESGRVSVWVHDRARPFDLTPGRGSSIFSLALNPTGSLLAGTDENGIVVWDLASRRRVSRPALAFTSRGDPFVAEHLSFSPDGRLLAAYDASGSVALWDGTGRSLVGELRINDSRRVTGALATLTFSRDSRVLAVSGDRPRKQDASSSGSGRIVLWDVDVESWRRKACALAYRDLNRDEWNQFVGAAWPYEPSCPRRR